MRVTAVLIMNMMGMLMMGTRRPVIGRVRGTQRGSAVQRLQRAEDGGQELRHRGVDRHRVADRGVGDARLHREVAEVYYVRKGSGVITIPGGGRGVAPETAPEAVPFPETNPAESPAEDTTSAPAE